MADLVPFMLGAVPSAFLAFHVGRWAQYRRLEAIARNMPRDSVALATLRRLDEQSRHAGPDRAS